MICKCTYIHSMEGARTPETHYVPDCTACMLTHTRVETGFLVHWIVGVVPCPLLGYHTPPLNCCNGRLSHVWETEVDTASNKKGTRKAGKPTRSAQEEAQVGRQTNIRTSLHQETLEESTTHSDR